jgi:hypothetical protein
MKNLKIKSRSKDDKKREEKKRDDKRRDDKKKDGSRRDIKKKDHKTDEKNQGMISMNLYSDSYLIGTGNATRQKIFSQCIGHRYPF